MTTESARLVERLLQWNRDGNHLHGPDALSVEASALITKQAEQLNRADGLVAALREIEEGKIERPIGNTYRTDGKPSKHDRCVHDVWMYEICENCLDAHARKALAEWGG